MLGGELYPTINYALCLFRNLQAAICSYYDFEQPNIKLPSMSFIRDVTIGEGESIPPNTQFTKTWRLQNSGKSFHMFTMISTSNLAYLRHTFLPIFLDRQFRFRQAKFSMKNYKLIFWGINYIFSGLTNRLLSSRT